MNLSDIDALGISEGTKQELEIDATRAIVDDEFYKKYSTTPKKGYRERAIDRLIDLKIPFHSEANIVNDLIDRSIIMVCPYCQSNMSQFNSSGTANNITVNFQCHSCHSIGSITLQTDGITFEPSK